MTLEQKRFFKLLNQVPRVAELWDVKSGRLKEDEIDTNLKDMSSGEEYMTKFFLGVWSGHSDSFGFDFFRAIKSVDEKNHGIIMTWVTDPFYP